MPTVANGISFDTDIWNARGENLEAEIRYAIAGQPGTVRLLAYLNHANMGSYREAIDAYLAGNGSRPDVTAHRHVGHAELRIRPSTSPAAIDSETSSTAVSVPCRVGNSTRRCSTTSSGTAGFTPSSA